MDISQNLQNILNKAIDSNKIFGCAFSLNYKGFRWSGAAGNLGPQSQFFIASVTKLFVSAIIMNLRSQSLLNLNDKLGDYIDPSLLQGLHIYQGKDYSNSITIRQLLAHSSGLPDYFQHKNPKGISLESEIFSGSDRAWSTEEAIQISKTFQPYFAPGSPGKAHYSNTNYQLLGLILERISGKSFAANCEELIFHALGLSQTYIFQDINDTAPVTIYYKQAKLPIPKAMASFGPSGAAISTSTDLLRFVVAYLKGSFFPASYLTEMQTWNKLFFPLQAGIGIHRFKLPPYFNPKGAIPELMGHSGMSGAMAYGNLQKDLYIVGTVNQMAYPSCSFQVAVKLILQVLKRYS